MVNIAMIRAIEFAKKQQSEEDGSVKTDLAHEFDGFKGTPVVGVWYDGAVFQPKSLMIANQYGSSRWWKHTTQADNPDAFDQAYFVCLDKKTGTPSLKEYHNINSEVYWFYEASNFDDEDRKISVQALFDILKCLDPRAKAIIDDGSNTWASEIHPDVSIFFKWRIVEWCGYDRYPPQYKKVVCSDLATKHGQECYTLIHNLYIKGILVGYMDEKAIVKLDKKDLADSILSHEVKTSFAESNYITLGDAFTLKV